MHMWFDKDSIIHIFVNNIILSKNSRDSGSPCTKVAVGKK